MLGKVYGEILESDESHATNTLLRNGAGRGAGAQAKQQTCKSADERLRCWRSLRRSPQRRRIRRRLLASRQAASAFLELILWRFYLRQAASESRELILWRSYLRCLTVCMPVI